MFQQRIASAAFKFTLIRTISYKEGVWTEDLAMSHPIACLLKNESNLPHDLTSFFRTILFYSWQFRATCPFLARFLPIFSKMTSLIHFHRSTICYNGTCQLRCSTAIPSVIRFLSILILYRYNKFDITHCSRTHP